MNPACAEQRNAHSAPSSLASPNRFAGIVAMRFPAASSYDVPCFLAAASIVDLRRLVSKAPGRMKLIVTLSAATLRAMPDRNAVRPARAPDDRSSPARGIFTV